VTGGGYFRLYPVQWTACGFRHINRLGHPGVFVIHPWEIDPDQPRLEEIKIRKADSPAGVSELGFGIRNLGFRAWRHYLNLDSTEKKLDWFLKQLAFGALGNVAERLANQEIVFSTPPVRPSLRLVTSEVG
jgi:hypothetical protein